MIIGMFLIGGLQLDDLHTQSLLLSICELIEIKRALIYPRLGVLLYTLSKKNHKIAFRCLAGYRRKRGGPAGF